MTTLFIVIFVLGMFHFIYESTILPSLRLELRYKLFNLRDQLIQLKANESEIIADDVFNAMENAICTSINRLPYLSLYLINEGNKEYSENEHFKKRVDNKIELLENCGNDKVIHINNKLLKYVSYAFIVNAGGWSYIFLPILCLVLFLKYVTSSIKSIREFIKEQSYKFAYAPENNFKNFYSIKI